MTNRVRVGTCTSLLQRRNPHKTVLCKAFPCLSEPVTRAYVGCRRLSAYGASLGLRRTVLEVRLPLLMAADASARAWSGVDAQTSRDMGQEWG